MNTSHKFFFTLISFILGMQSNALGMNLNIEKESQASSIMFHLSSELSIQVQHARNHVTPYITFWNLQGEIHKIRFGYGVIVTPAHMAYAAINIPIYGKNKFATSFIVDLSKLRKGNNYEIQLVIDQDKVLCYFIGSAGHLLQLEKEM
jgi:hypothetical protein